jgi:D-glycero-D-manno-heptose 1,7-bisphosphate phosphatase
MQPKALFLDRDGTINVECGFLYQPEKFVFIDGIMELCQRAQNLGYLIIVITNQSGIARGYYTDADFQKLNRYMLEEFAKQGITITDVFYCPELDSPRSKPECGMFLEARDKYNIDMEHSVSVGDRERDILAAQGAGVGTNFLFTNDFTPIIKVL